MRFINDSENTIIEDTQNINIMNYVQMFGNTASSGVFHPNCKIFKDPYIFGIIGYRIELNCIVAIGDPLCAKENRLNLAKSFYNFSRRQNKKLIYIMVSEAFANEILNYFGVAIFQFGHEINVDCTLDLKNSTGKYARHLRQKYNNAILNKISVHEHYYHNTHNNSEINQIFTDMANEWLANRRGPQAYILPINVFSDVENKRWFYAKKNNQIIAFLMLNKLDSCKSWVIDGSVFTRSNAPKSTSEFMILEVIDKLRNEKYKTLSTGSIASSDVGRIDGCSWLSKLLIHFLIRLFFKIFKLKHRQRYWKKFQPQKKPAFIIFSSSNISLIEVLAILRAYNINI